MSVDPEMELWRKEWASTNSRNDAPLPREVVASVVRQQRRSHVVLAANIAFAIVLLAGSLITAKRMHSAEVVLWAVCVWMTTLIAAYLSVEGWRRSRISTMQSVADYARFHRKRAIADQWRVRTGVILLVVQATIAAVWFTTDLLRERIAWLRFGTAMAVLLAVTVVWIYIFGRVWRRATAVLELKMPEDDESEPDRNEVSDRCG